MILGVSVSVPLGARLHMGCGAQKKNPGVSEGSDEAGGAVSGDKEGTG